MILRNLREVMRARGFDCNCEQADLKVFYGWINTKNQVKKGEKSTMLYMPKRVDEIEKEIAAGKNRKEIERFKLVPFFCECQTEKNGKPSAVQTVADEKVQPYQDYIKEAKQAAWDLSIYESIRKEALKEAWKQEKNTEKAVILALQIAKDIEQKQHEGLATIERIDRINQDLDTIFNETFALLKKAE